jgi:membrane peptidoglycan carboxypeptidase
LGESYCAGKQIMKSKRIDSDHYSWDAEPRRFSWKRFLLWTATIGICLLLIGVTAGLVGFEFLRKKYEKRALEFDLDGVRQMEAASVLLDRRGEEIGKLFIQNRNPVAYSAISPWMTKAVVAAEDNRFYDHKGVDWLGVARAAIENYRRGRIAQGASTVTQQLARNSFDMRERTYERKLVEMFLAMRIEREFSKDDIMEAYLNRVYFGSGFYGVEAASRGYFGKPASELGPGEAAMLAGLLRSPQALSPWNNFNAAQASRNLVLRRMRDNGFLSRRELREQMDLPLEVQPRRNPHRVNYAVEMIRQQVVAAIGFERAMNGGYLIETTIDSELQADAERAVLQQLEAIESRPGYPHETLATYRANYSTMEERVNRGEFLRLPRPKYLQGAALVLDNTSGAILAMVGGRDYRHSEYNRATQARRPAGTAFTPLVFAAAYNEGVFPGSVVDDGCIDNRFVMVGGETGILGEWGVERADNEYEGLMTTSMALMKGKNAATVRLGFAIGLERFRQAVEAMGIRSPLRNYANAYLGSSEVTLEELTLAYTNFPTLGRRPERTFIVQAIRAADGALIYEAEPRSVKSISPEAAFQTHAALADIMSKGKGEAAFTRFGLERMPVAGKPGTAYNFTDTYFLGYTGTITCGVWIGFDMPTRIFRGAFGSDLALPVWAKIMNQAAREFPPRGVPRPTTLQPVEVCFRTGLPATPKCVEKDENGQERSTTTIVLATADQIPAGRCEMNSLGIRPYARAFEEEEWPRAAPAIDLTRIRPIAIQSPSLLGLTDVYQAVQPGVARLLDEGALPVARALPVEGVEAVHELSEDGIPVAAAVAVDAAPPVAVPAGEPEVRRADSGISARFLENPALRIAPPTPVEF